ncbi:hypothetical protein UFOVP1290_53 [uncultured Caudovirales phage]|uniref:Uncharacterized protein n=1 Tax=uncultured Caudovirales phage TaxID=2100421 RepID=A0A6J5RGS4_9CAUD|nr:hypothetical protein UFOVP1290_53 [uncultured Caudovirales phage]
MKGTILLNYGDSTKNVEEEEKMRFLKDVLDQMGVPINDFWNTDEPLSIEQKIKLRAILATYSVQVIDDLDGHLQIYVEDELVGEWNKCTYKLKRDLRQLDPRKQLYLEMTVDFWTIFEDEPQKE